MRVSWFPGGGPDAVTGQPTPPQTSHLERLLAQGGFALTAELVPPLSTAANALLAKAAPLKGRADAVNITDGPNARVHLSATASAAILAANGFEPVLQLTCRDRNRLALQADLLGAAAQGVGNLLILSGDDPAAGDQPDAKPVFDMDSRALIAMARDMGEKGQLPNGREIDRPPRFFIGAADVPSANPDAAWRRALAGKADAGARFLQTQLCFDIDVIRAYAGHLADAGLDKRLHVLIGLGPLASAKSARWMRDNLWGVIMPDAVIERLEAAADQRSEGIAICIELLEQLVEIPALAGAHLMAPVNGASIAAVIDGFKSRPGR